MSINKQISRLISNRTLYQKDIASALGISPQLLSHYKTGRRKLNPKNPRHQLIIKKMKGLK